MQSLSHAVQLVCVYAIPLIFAITLHEAAHGWMAARLGDKTAVMYGRVTLNPLAHIDPIGTIAVPGALLLMSALSGGGGLLLGLLNHRLEAGQGVWKKIRQAAQGKAGSLMKF